MAKSRQSARTEHWLQIAFAESSRRSFSSFLSKCEGGKNMEDWGPRQAAFRCHVSSATPISNPPVVDSADTVTCQLSQRKGKRAATNHWTSWGNR
jgi:hypothetical protein